ncbi:MAG: hypothetical protein ABW167_02870 [Baekduia sp.]
MGRLQRGMLMLATVIALLAAGGAAVLLLHHAGRPSAPVAPAADPTIAATTAPTANAGTAVSTARLPDASRFIAPTGDDTGDCTRADPCATLDRAYHAARPGQLVEIAAGHYPEQVITPDDAKSGSGCVSRARAAACVTFVPARGASASFVGVTFGPSYGKPGPRGIALVGGGDRRLAVGTSVFNQAVEVGLRNVRQRLLYITGGRDLAIRGGSIGGTSAPDGTHPEIQRVYGSDPLIVPTRLTIEGVLFHDINTTSKTAHVDCLQIENGRGLVIRGNRFERCGSVGLRMSYGADGNESPPEHVLIEDNIFGRCANTPVSECYYSAQLGVGRHVVVRHNTSDQAFQPAGGAEFATHVRYEHNLAPGVSCEAGVTYVRNVWTEEQCGTTDRVVDSLGLSADLRSPSTVVPHVGARGLRE